MKTITETSHLTGIGHHTVKQLVHLGNVPIVQRGIVGRGNQNTLLSDEVCSTLGLLRTAKLPLTVAKCYVAKTCVGFVLSMVALWQHY